VTGQNQSPVLIIEIVLESVAADPTTLVFWAFAVIASVYIPFKAMRQSGMPEAKPEG
jgi:hypothetical protein